MSDAVVPQRDGWWWQPGTDVAVIKVDADYELALAQIHAEREPSCIRIWAGYISRDEP